MLHERRALGEENTSLTKRDSIYRFTNNMNVLKSYFSDLEACVELRGSAHAVPLNRTMATPRSQPRGF